MQFYENLDKIMHNAQEIEKSLSAENLPTETFIKMSKELAALSPVAAKIKMLQKNISEMDDLKQMLEDKTSDAELRNIAQEEIKVLEENKEKLEKEIKIMLLPKDQDDDKNAIFEIRAGTGGDEAALFAADLCNIYLRYADRKGWKTEILSITETGIGGYKEASLSISGSNVFAHLKFESGVHRVQRVPTTETSGRIHTSAATVAVLPEVEDIDVSIEEKDLRVDVYRASGPGGQSVNTTDSAVRIVHIPTGITVCQQDEKSQHKNRAKAMKILRARLYDAQKQEQEAKRAASRKSQVGSGDRSERIRTYNFPQGRVTDHRINVTLYKMDAIMKGGEIDDFINALTQQDEADKLANSEYV